MKSGISELHNLYFLNSRSSSPVNISTVIQGGFYLPEVPTVDETQVIPTDNVTAWLESYACMRLINQLFTVNNYFIVYIPYGSYVKDVDGYKSRGNFSFEKSDCEQWVGNANFNSSVYATCDTVDGIVPGMTVLEGLQDSALDLVMNNYKPAFTQTFSDGNYTYDAEDVIKSSLSGWSNYGYNYSLLDQNYYFAPDALSSVENFREQLFAVTNIRPDSAGVFNLPVCVLDDLSSMPECSTAVPESDASGAKSPLTFDQTSWCYVHPMNCLGDQSGVLPSKNSTYGFQYFRDHVSSRVVNSFDSDFLAGPFPDTGSNKRSDLKTWTTIDVVPMG